MEVHKAPPPTPLPIPTIHIHSRGCVLAKWNAPSANRWQRGRGKSCFRRVFFLCPYIFIYEGVRDMMDLWETLEPLEEPEREPIKPKKQKNRKPKKQIVQPIQPIQPVLPIQMPIQIQSPTTKRIHDALYKPRRSYLNETPGTVRTGRVEKPVRVRRKKKKRKWNEPARSVEELKPLEQLAPSTQRLLKGLMNTLKKEVKDLSDVHALAEWVHTPKCANARRNRRNAVMRVTGISIPVDPRTYPARNRGPRRKELRKQTYSERDFHTLIVKIQKEHGKKYMHINENMPLEMYIATMAWYTGARSCEVPGVKIYIDEDRIMAYIPAAKGSADRHVCVSTLHEAKKDPLLMGMLRKYHHMKKNRENLSQKKINSAREMWLRTLKKCGLSSTRWSFHSIRHAWITRRRNEIFDDVIEKCLPEAQKMIEEGADKLEVARYVRNQLCEELKKYTGHKDAKNVHEYGSCPAILTALRTRGVQI